MDKIRYGAVIILIILVLLVAIFIFEVYPAVHKVTYQQAFCLAASDNSTAMDAAVSNGIDCFRDDISLNQADMDFVSNITRKGAQYLGILDYNTVGAHPSPKGCILECNWTSDVWNTSVSKAVADYPEIHTWEIYNEPLVVNFASGYENRSALDYFNMIKSAYQIIKKNNPNSTVVCFGGAELFPFSSVEVEYWFYQKVWSYGVANYCDAVSLHMYTQPYYNLSQQISSSGATLVQELNYTLNLYENLTHKPVWITETGIPSNNWTAGLNLSEQKQASFLTQDFNFFASYKFVKRIYWFHLAGGGNDGDFGLLNSTTLQPKPAWYSFLYFYHNSTG